MSYRAQEQIECPVCLKPIEAGHMNRHIEIKHTPVKEKYIELGYKYGVKGRTRKKIIEEQLW